MSNTVLQPTSIDEGTATVPLPPDAEVPPSGAAPTSAELVEPSFYVVSPGKFLILFFSTMGFYQVYWFFKNWKRQQEIGEDVSPVWRTVFVLFVTHNLFSRMESRAVEAHVNQGWCSHNTATFFVMVTVLLGAAAGLLDATLSVPGEFGASDLLSYGATFLQAIPLLKAQSVANAVCGDPRGESNARLSAINLVFVCLGGLLWLLTLLAFIYPELASE